MERTLAKTNTEKLLDDLYTFLLPYRKEAKEVNFNANKNLSQRDLHKDYLDSEVLEINNYRGYSIKVWVKKN